jgi:DNA (cytosine-5)-methyltransferase 1
MAVHEVLGGELAWVADNDPGAAAILAHRFPLVPNLGDITAVDWSAVEPVDVLTAGFPCQDISCAGRRAGLRTGNRSGLWFHVARALAE